MFRCADTILLRKWLKMDVGKYKIVGPETTDVTCPRKTYPSYEWQYTLFLLPHIAFFGFMSSAKWKKQTLHNHCLLVSCHKFLSKLFSDALSSLSCTNRAKHLLPPILSWELWTVYRNTPSFYLHWPLLMISFFWRQVEACLMFFVGAVEVNVLAQGALLPVTQWLGSKTQPSHREADTLHLSYRRHLRTHQILRGRTRIFARAYSPHQTMHPTWPSEELRSMLGQRVRDPSPIALSSELQWGLTFIEPIRPYYLG